MPHCCQKERISRIATKRGSRHLCAYTTLHGGIAAKKPAHACTACVLAYAAESIVRLLLAAYQLENCGLSEPPCLNWSYANSGSMFRESHLKSMKKSKSTTQKNCDLP